MNYFIYQPTLILDSDQTLWSSGCSFFCGVQTATTLVYLFFINKKFINTEKTGMLYTKQLPLPLLVTLGIALGFSFIPPWIAQNRIYTLAWIGGATCITFLTTILILVPKSELKQIVNLITTKSNKT